MIASIGVIYIAAALVVIALIAVLNALTFPRLKARSATEYPQAGQPPRVSVMIPARDEAAVIRETLALLLAQDYANFEVILLDDNSSDGTGDLARALNDPRLTVLAGQPLPPDWMGKNWACQQMSERAEGDILLFTDADVRWREGALAALMAEMERTRADLFTVWPTQHTETPAERLVVPLMAVVILGYLPVWAVHYVPSALFGAANGQCMAWRRSAYCAVGGHEAVRNNVLEDVTLARQVKARGMRLRMADGTGRITCRMYANWQTVRDGYAKNIIAGYGGSVPLLLATVFHWLIFLFPWIWLVSGWDVPWLDHERLWALAMIALGYGVRMLTAAFTRQRVLDGLLLPVSVILMTIIAVQALYWQGRYGGPRWKGRTITRTKAKRWVRNRSSSSARASAD